MAAASAAPAAPAVRFDGITKRYPGSVALSGVSFEIAPGSCHALCGENGAGKSTLGKILAGIVEPDEGRLFVAGREVRFASPRDALDAGIGMVHQELAFCENLSVAENLCLGATPRRGRLVDRGAMAARAEAMLARIGTSLDVRRLVGELPVGQQQMVQIAAAVEGGARVVVFDEPTSSLTEHEARQLYALVERLRAGGVTCVYVSHRMPEIYRLCDAITVLRDGRHVVTAPTAALDEGALVRAMIGRSVESYLPQHMDAAPGPERLRVEGLTSPAKFADVSFTLRGGEVLGLAGLVGSGRSEVAKAIFGLDPAATGRVWVDGAPARIRHPREAMRLGLGFVPEDRKREGLVLSLGGRDNTSLPILRRLARLLMVRRDEERAIAEEYFARLRVRAPGVDAVVAGLSGGNQQKIVLAKWLAARSRVLILDEPTRGVDVGAKAEIHGLIDELARAGQAVLLISSELPEVVALSSRVLVLRAGRVVGEVPRDRATPETLIRLMTGLEAAAG